MRVVLVTNMAAPYRIPVWESLAEKVGDLIVLLCSDREVNRVWRVGDLGGYKFRYKILRGRHWYVQSRDWAIHWNPGLWRELGLLRPTHILITGYETPSYMTAILFAKLHRVPLTIWWGSHAYSSRSRRGPVAWLRKRLVRLADSYVTYGSLATEYLRQLGIPAKRIVTGVNTVDVEGLGRLVDAARAEERERPHKPLRFLYVGQFIERKGVSELLRAFRVLPKNEAVLRLVGYGPLEQELRAYAEVQGMDNVEFPGPTRTMEETARHYAWADVLVLPSLIEVWGLVLNEALASGLWVLASNRAGATRDLVERSPFPVGKVFDSSQEGALIQALRSALEGDRTDRDMIAKWGRTFTPAKYASAIWQALSRSNALTE